MNEVAKTTEKATNKKEQQVTNELNLEGIKKILSEPQNAEKLVQGFPKNLEKTLEKDQGGLDQIKKFSRSLKEARKTLEAKSTSGQLAPEAIKDLTKDKEGLTAFETSLNTCLQNNEVILKANDKIINNLKKMDNKEGKDINIDEKSIVSKKVELNDQQDVVLTYSLSAKGSTTANEVTVTLDTDGKLSATSDNIKMNGKYYTVVEGNDGSDKFELRPNPEGLLNELNTYKVSGAEGVAITKKESLYTIDFTVQKAVEAEDAVVANATAIPPTEAKDAVAAVPAVKVSFDLDANGKLDGDNSWENTDGYKLTIDETKKTFALVAPKKVEAPVVEEETEDVVQELVETPKPGVILEKDKILEKFRGNDPAETAKVVDRTKNIPTERNKFTDITTLVAIKPNDKEETKVQKQVLIDLLNTGDLKGFQTKVGTEDDGLFGKNTLAATKKYLNGGKPEDIKTGVDAETKAKTDAAKKTAEETNKNKATNMINATKNQQSRTTYTEDNGSTIKITNIEGNIIKKNDDNSFNEYNQNSGKWDLLPSFYSLYGKVTAFDKKNTSFLENLKASTSKLIPKTTDEHLNVEKERKTTAEAKNITPSPYNKLYTPM